MLDHEQRIKKIVQTPASPPSMGVDNSYLERSLDDEVKARFFTQHVPVTEEWIRWVESKRQFRDLFSLTTTLNKSSAALAWWFAEHVVPTHPDESLLVVQRMGGQFQHILWMAVVREFHKSKPTSDTLGKWIPLLLHHEYACESREELDFVFTACSWPDDAVAALLLFEHLASPQLVLRRPLRVSP